MGHDLTDRIRRLNMSHSTKRAYGLSTGLALFALALSAPISLQAKEAPEPAAEAVPTPALSLRPTPAPAPAASLPESSPAEPSEPAAAASPDSATVTADPVRTAEAAPARPAVRSGAPSVLLKMIPNADAAYMEELQARLDAVASGEQPDTYVTEWRGPNFGSLMENHVWLLSDTGTLTLKITDASGKPVETPLDDAAAAALSPQVDGCEARIAKRARLSAYPVKLSGRSPALIGGPYTLYCYPGADLTREAQTSERNIEGLMASEDIPLESRVASAYGMVAGNRMREFAKSTPNPTRAQEIAECIETRTELGSRFPTYGKGWLNTPEKVRASCERDAAK
jgi:hypothetical protein